MGTALVEGRIQARFEFEIMGADTLALPESSQGYRYVLAVLDHFTRYAWAVPMTDKSAKSTMEAFLQITTPMGCPKTLISDNGTEFKNEDFVKLCKNFNIRQHFCTPYHPQSDGVVERFNRTLITMLKAYVNESGKDWPKFLQKVVAANNSMVHPVTQVAPYTAMMKIDKEALVFSLPQTTEACEANEYSQLREWIAKYTAETNEWRDHAENQKRDDKKKQNVGDLVWCLDYTVNTKKGERQHKLQRKWCGPWSVVSTWGNVTVTIKRIGGGGEIRRAHVDQLKPFQFTKQTPKELRRQSEPPRPTKELQLAIAAEAEKEGKESAMNTTNADNDEEDNPKDDTEYVVEKIVGHFHNDGGFWFLIKWKDYVETTWEHESLVSAPTRITEYFREVCRDFD